MAQAARPLPSAHDIPAPPRLRAVPPPRNAARRPAPAVIRRRRAVALGGLVGLALLAIAALSIGGSSASASGQIAALLRHGAADPSSLCGHLSPGMLASAGGHAACVRNSPARGPGASVGGIRIHGDTATAIVHRPDADEVVSLVRRDGAWQIDDVR